MNIGVVGTKGEDMVARFMRNKGFTLIKRNYQCRWGEIDIVAEMGDFIVFTEVKTRKEDTSIPIEEAVDIRKRKRLILSAEDFLSKYPSDKQPRFDTAMVTVSKKPDGNTGYSLKYIESAF